MLLATVVGCKTFKSSLIFLMFPSISLYDYLSLFAVTSLYKWISRLRRFSSWIPSLKIWIQLPVPKIWNGINRPYAYDVTHSKNDLSKVKSWQMIGKLHLFARINLPVSSEWGCDVSEVQGDTFVDVTQLFRHADLESWFRFSPFSLNCVRISIKHCSSKIYQKNISIIFHQFSDYLSFRRPHHKVKPANQNHNIKHRNTTPTSQCLEIGQETTAERGAQSIQKMYA